MVPGERGGKNSELPVPLKMAVPQRPTIPLVGRRGGGGVGAGAVESHLLRQVGGNKMAAAEDGCGVGADTDQELEELLESKSP